MSGWRAPNAFERVILALFLGVLVGVFAGEPAGALSIVGDAYITLLQMTVLPYILVSLMAGLGSLDAAMARRIGARAGGMILSLWGVALLSVLSLPLAFPKWKSAAFFSTSMTTDSATFDPLTLYLPANPFHALSHGVVPAVVFFSISLGLALIAVEQKEHLLQNLRNVSDALMKIASYVAKVAPIGIFAISASAAGVLRVEELSRLQVFLWVYLMGWAVFAFFTLPALVAYATPFSYREALRESRTPMVTAFAAGTVLVVLPMIAERCKRLVEEHGLEGPEADTTIDVLVPTAYSFPSVGTMLGLGFVLFAAWYVGAPLSATQYPAFVSVGALVAFGSLPVAIPFMLDFFGLPADLFQLYVLGSVVTARFAVALGAMQGVVLCLLAVSAVLGTLRVRQLLQICVMGVAVSFAAMLALGFTLTQAIPFAYKGEEAFVNMPPLYPAVKNDQVELPPPLSQEDLRQPRLSLVRTRGSLRVGYLADRLPFAYRSSSGNVVGFDLDLLNLLARDLNARIEIVRLDFESATDALSTGRLDVVVGGLAITPQRAIKASFSRSYFDHSLGFIVPDRDRGEWRILADVNGRGRVKVAMPPARHYEATIREVLPRAEIVRISSPRDFLRKQTDGADALAISAEAGSAWTLIYPDFSVVVPDGLHVKGSTGFALPLGRSEMTRYIDTWLELAEKNGVIRRLFEYWILGRDPAGRSPRWSIMSDVLGWGLPEDVAEESQAESSE